MKTSAVCRPRHALVLVVLLGAAFAQSGCLDAGDDAEVVVTFYPVAFLAESIAGDTVTVRTVLPTGADQHSWSPGVRDVLLLQKAELVLGHSEGLESWLVDLRAGDLDGEKVYFTAERVLRLVESGVLDAHDDHDGDHGVHEDDHDDHDDHANETGNQTGNETGTTSGNETGNQTGNETEDHDDHVDDHDDHDDHGDNGEGDDGHDHGGIDPHTWLDPVLYMEQAKDVHAALVGAFPEHAETFDANLDQFSLRLLALDANFDAELRDCRLDLVITEHDAFSYMGDRYAFDIVSAAGVNPEAESDPRTVRDIIGLVETHDVPALLVETPTGTGVLHAIARDRGMPTAVLDPLETLSREHQEAGDDYVDVMLANLEALKTARDCHS